MHKRLFRNNIKKSVQDYALYFFTLVISSTLFFAFLSLTSVYNDILSGDGNYSLTLFQNTIRYAVLVISIIFVSLISYVNAFMLKQRSQEFSLYLILGMEQRTVAKQFFGETLFFGMCAVLTGCVSGTVLSGMMTAFVKRTITGNGQFQFGFYPDTILETLLFFFCVFLLVGLKNARKLYKIKLIDLMRERRQGEGCEHGKRYYITSFLLVFLCFIIMGVVLCQFSMANGKFAGEVPGTISNRYQTMAILAALIGIFAFYHAVSFGLLMIRRHKKWKYQRINSVLIGNLFHRVSSTAKVLSVSTLAITVSLVAFVILPMTAEISTGYLKYRMPYEIMINNTYRYIDKLEDIPEIDYTFVKDILKDHQIEVSEEVVQESYFVWKRDFNTVETREHWRDLPRLAIRLSDYNAMREMAGFEPVALADNGFFMHLDYELDQERVKADIDSEQIQLDDGTILYLADTAVYNEPLGQYLFHSVDSVLVFPDSICDRLYLACTCYYADTQKSVPYNLCDLIRNEIEAEFQAQYGYLFEKYEAKYQSDKNYTSFIEPIRFWTQENNDTQLTATSIRLLGIYSGVIFFIICMTVLALHTITASIEQHAQYRILEQIGVEKREIAKVISHQSFLYFFIPCMMALIIALLLIYSFTLRYGHKVFTYISTVGFQFGVLIPSLLIIMILIIYYGATIYTIKKKVVHILEK